MPQPCAHARLVHRHVTAPISHGATFVAMSALVVYGDLVSKWLAVTLWAGETHPLAAGLRIQVVYNSLGAFSTSLGHLTWEINVATTVMAVLLSSAVSGRLAALDATAPATLGLVAGAGLGNLASLLGSSAGVPDFLAVSDGRGGALVLNLADIAAYLGIVCCVRLAVGLMRARARDTRRRTPHTARRTTGRAA
ncbi:MAG: signal peptidase II [Gemmatimonadaceae bacterium]|nr:signal peptidase II [Gemmatimonadaceae bacterium]NUP54582.1 signal peptidase II [Gemmatimonadaceae bacterium]NUP72604.1 signal peptidase II [Gemmatimonadaceae bacterium]NUR35392.1 signal peptidase II [Gemmatimonadaceae bacterium]NUS33451.1 signal peptidase II [Gemmatimonadaceae bacterium]